MATITVTTDAFSRDITKYLATSDTYIVQGPMKPVQLNGAVSFARDNVGYMVPYATFLDNDQSAATNPTSVSGKAFQCQAGLYRAIHDLRAFSANGPGQSTNRYSNDALTSTFGAGTLTFTARRPGTSSVRVRFVVAGNNTVRSFAFAGADITLNVATDGGGAVDAAETCTAIAAAFEANATANKLVTTTAGGTGTELVAAFAYTALTGGSLYGGFVVPGATPDGDVRYLATDGGPGSTAIQVRHVVAGNNTPLPVSASLGPARLTVNVATNGGGTATSTGTLVAAAVNADGVAKSFVSAAALAGGAGVVAAVAYTALSAGLDGGGALGPRVYYVYKDLRDALPTKVLLGYDHAALMFGL